MPGVLTEVTEITTALGLSGATDLASALHSPPGSLVNVEGPHWARVRDALQADLHLEAFESSWANGRAFLEADDGLRGRVPRVIEWKGPQRQPGYDTLPADLRVDHVYLISCKYQSKILSNSSPANLFLRRLGERTVEPNAASWYAIVAADEYRHFYDCVRRYVGMSLLPTDPADLTGAQLGRIRSACGRTWPSELAGVWAELSLAVAAGSAERWNEQLDTPARREEMLWRLLRLGPAPYFVLGTSPSGPMRLRIGTPWDWRQHFRLEALQIWAESAGQPMVRWRGELSESTGGIGRARGAERVVEGHVEVRWAHGRFSTVEAKVYLDTPHAEVPGYFPLTSADQRFTDVPLWTD